jgi:hypothetical protein
MIAQCVPLTLTVESGSAWREDVLHHTSKIGDGAARGFTAEAKPAVRFAVMPALAIKLPAVAVEEHDSWECASFSACVLDAHQHFCFTITAMHRMLREAADHAGLNSPRLPANLATAVAK